MGRTPRLHAVSCCTWFVQSLGIGFTWPTKVQNASYLLRIDCFFRSPLPVDVSNAVFRDHDANCEGVIGTVHDSVFVVNGSFVLGRRSHAFASCLVVKCKICRCSNLGHIRPRPTLVPRAKEIQQLTFHIDNYRDKRSTRPLSTTVLPWPKTAGSSTRTNDDGSKGDASKHDENSWTAQGSTIRKSWRA